MLSVIAVIMLVKALTALYLTALVILVFYTNIIPYLPKTELSLNETDRKWKWHTLENDTAQNDVEWLPIPNPVIIVNLIIVSLVCMCFSFIILTG